MKTDENYQQQQQIQDLKALQSKARKNKAEASKGSKGSHYTRRRVQPDSSEQYLLPTQIPKSKGTQSILTQGCENQLSKALIRIPYNLLLTQKFSSLNCLHVQNVQIMINVQKQQEYVTVFARSVKPQKVMEIENQQKIDSPKYPSSNDDKIEQNNVSQVEDLIVAVNIWGKFVYLSAFEAQNKTIKKIRKDLGSFEQSEILKFKVKQVNSDLLIYLNLKLQEKYSDDFNGLVNQGNTCYMNSYLQTLYHIPAFRNLVYEAEVQEETKFPATLQELFFNLGRSEKPVSPELLVKSFGWGKRQASIQQDAQQFSCLFFEALQRKLNESAPLKGYRNRTIDGLFKGQLNHYLRCTQVGTVIDNADFRRENFEEFLDLQLPIYPTLTESLDAYTTQVHMGGDNKYWTDEYGFQQAYKGIPFYIEGVKIAYFPPILMIQLKRFEYCFEKEHNVKILTSLEYQEEFDFSQWSITGQKEEYDLYAVLVHEGAKAESGHYYNFVKVGDLWYKFNDEIVQQVSRQKALQYNFGGFHESLHFDAKQMKVEKKLVESKTTAYMLVYVKKQLKQELMTDENKLPEWIEKKNCNKLEQEEMKKNRKKFINTVSVIDWQSSLQSGDCPDMGFIDDLILEAVKINFQHVPKQANMLDWLNNQKIIENQPEQKKKKVPKKPSKLGQKSDEEKINEAGIYIYYASPERENIISFTPKPQHKMEDLLKVSPDPNPIILKAPFQIKKDEYLAVIKKYSVVKDSYDIAISFTYETLMPIKKDLRYSELLTILEDNFSKKLTLPIEGQLGEDGIQKNCEFYIDDWKLGPIKISQYSGPVPYPVPAKNQLLVCVFAELSPSLTVQEADQYSFPKWYQNKKDTINLTVAEEKSPMSIELKEVHVSMSLTELRKLIFETVLKQKQSEYASPQNIVLRARLKKGSKIYSQVSEPECSTIKDLIKVQNRVEFSFSSLTVQSRLSQFVIQFSYRTKDFDYSEPIQVVINRNEESPAVVKLIKQHPRILELLEIDGFTEDQAELIILSKDWLAINDIVNTQGKALLKGDFANFLKTTKNPILVVQGRTTLALQGESKVQIKQQEDPFVSILIHQVSQSIQKVGIPRYLKVDKRMQLHELKNRILNLIKDQAYGWQGKIYMCNPFKTRILLYGKDNKRAIELTDLESLQELKRLKIEEKVNNLDSKRKRSKEMKNSARKESIVEEVKEAILEEIKQAAQEQQITAVKQKGEQSKTMQNEKIEENMDNVNAGQNLNNRNAGQQEQNEVQVLGEEEVTKIQGPETIYGVFPKVKLLKMQIIHNYLIKPNIALRLNVDD